MIISKDTLNSLLSGKNEMTPERIAELRAILDADLLDQGTAFYMACDDLPSALDTIEAQAALIAKHHAERSYSYIGKDGKSTKARDLEDQRDELAARSEAQAKRIEELEAALKDASISVVAFAALEAVSAAKSHGLPTGHLLPHHYDMLEKHGARMASFTRAALQPKEPS